MAHMKESSPSRKHYSGLPKAFLAHKGGQAESCFRISWTVPEPDKAHQLLWDVKCREVLDLTAGVSIG